MVLPHAIEDIFHAARLKQPHERQAFLRSACGDNNDTIALLESLLASDAAADEFLETPAAQLIGLDEPQCDRGTWNGTSIGNYRILRTIAAGGMGIVYEAEQSSPRRNVALKLLRRALYSKASVRRFQRESELLGRLRHTGIAQIYEAGVHREEGEATPFFAMELLDGAVPITDYARQRSVTNNERVTLLCQVCDAVQYCHDQGVIHRDLKPGNVLVTPDGTPKVIDFGVAFVQNVEASTLAWRTTGHPLIGSLAYMSPEQVGSDVEAVDAISDVYALGVIAYEFLSDRLPLDLAELPPLEAARMIRDEEPLPLGAVNPQCRGDLETIVATALAKEKSRRYPSAASLAADLRRFLANEPIQARRAGTFYHLRKFVRRNRALSTGVAIAFLGLLFGGGTATWQALSAIRERNSARAHAAQADRERTRAEENLARARAVVDGMVTRLAHDLGDVPHMTEIQRALFEEALKFYEEVIEQGLDDPAIRRETGLACLNVAGIHGTLRNYEEWAEAGERAVGIFEELLQDEPDDPEYLHLLAESLGSVAGASFFRDRNEESLDRSLEILEIRRKLAQRFPDDLEHRRRLAATYSHLGNNLQRIPGRADEAEWSFREAFLQFEGIRRDFPELPKGWLDGDEAHAHHWLANVLAWQKHDYDSAEALLRRAVAIRKQLWQESPNHPNTCYELAQARLWLGMVLNETGRVAEAVTEFQAAADMLEPLVDGYPAVAENRRRLRMAYVGQCWALARVDKASAAEAARRAITLPLGPEPGDPISLGEAYYCLGCQTLFEPTDEAAEAFRQSIRVFEEVVDQDRPYKARGERWLRKTLSQCPIEEYRDYERAVAMFNVLLERGLMNAFDWKHLGFANYGMGHYQEAVEALHESIAMGRDHDGDLMELLAMAYWQVGEVEKAHAWHQRASELPRYGIVVDPHVDLSTEFANPLEP